MNSQTQIETESVDEEIAHAWDKAERAILTVFDDMDIEPNDALNILLHTAVHIVLIEGSVEKEILMAGLSSTYDNCLQNLIDQSEVH